jgi:lipoate-protein ligase A
MRSIKYVNLKGIHIFDQLRYEEILYRHSKSNWFLWNYGPVQPAIVLGYSGKILELVNVNEARRDQIPLIRRYTGGGTVIVDQSTLFSSFIMNSADAGTPPYPRNIMTWSEGVYGPVFNRLMRGGNQVIKKPVAFS